ncbi:endonuclease/exonuclease/phosphatase family protein [Luteimicrobium sp. NPDC057192]|uniref:endonuclease/exonuclease/phosphatase family protein n=1 Tax=Luteimicrobium sp. NPDC057192 TaxID=3346042 RepID=UPI003642DE7A
MDLVPAAPDDARRTSDTDRASDADHARRARRGSTASLAVAVVLALLLAPAVAVTLARGVGYDRRTPFAQLVSVAPWFGAWALLVGLTGLVVALAVVRRAGAARRTLLVVSAVAGVVVAVQAVWWAPLATGSTDAGSAGATPELRVMTVNAFVGRADADAMVRTVREEGVQVLAVEELSDGLLARLHAAGLDDALPYRVTGSVGPGNRGTGLWSALPLTDADAGESTWFAMPSATLAAGSGVPVRVTAVHTVPPSVGSTSIWASDLRVVRDRLAGDPTAQVALGDFNATRDHSGFRDVLGDRFADAADRGGHATLTWPTNRVFPPLVGIDHVLVDRSDTVTEVRTVRVPGSDHAALLATVGLVPASR